MRLTVPAPWLWHFKVCGVRGFGLGVSGFRVQGWGFSTKDEGCELWGDGFEAAAGCGVKSCSQGLVPFSSNRFRVWGLRV